MTDSGAARGRPRLALYSHDTMGFGHVRRNLLIARALVAPPLEAEVLLIAGMREAGAFAMPPGVDCLTLPAYRKNDDGRYAPRSLACDMEMLTALRSATIKAALKRFRPDLLVVDTAPSGAVGELLPVLRSLARHRRTRTVLGLREVLDAPETIRRQWWKQRNYEAVHRYFDEIWVYGDPSVYETGAEYGFDDTLRGKLRYAGYLDPAMRLASPEAEDPAVLAVERAGEPYVLCAVGGGQDGARVTQAFAEAGPPPGHRGVIVTGPFMPADARAELRQAALRDPRLTVLEFVSEPIRLVHGAARVVTMGGYNTVTEILSLGKRALIVPRVAPRVEQLIRAERLVQRGLIELMRPDALTPERLAAWMRSEALPPPDPTRIDLGGLARIPRFVAELLATHARPGTARLNLIVPVPEGIRHAVA